MSEFQVGKTYIVTSNRTISLHPVKITVREITNTTICISFEGREGFERFLIKDFNDRYDMIEEVSGKTMLDGYPS